MEKVNINPVPVLFILMILALAIIGRGINLLVGNIESIPEPKEPTTNPASEGVQADDIYRASLRPQFPGVWSQADIDYSKPTTSYRASHYYPPAGGPNCSAFYDGYCHSKMASGERWEDWMGAAVAMPADIPFWSVLVITEPASIRGRYVVLDRGGAIVTKDGISWVDFLWDLETWPLKHGELIKGYILPPGMED